MADSDTPALADLYDECDPLRPITVRWRWARPPFVATFTWNGRDYSVARWTRGAALDRAYALRDRRHAARQRLRDEQRRAEKALPLAEWRAVRRQRAPLELAALQEALAMLESADG